MATTKKTSSTTKKSSSTKKKSSSSTVKIPTTTKQVEKLVKKTAKKNPAVFIVILILVVAIAGGVFAYLYFTGFFDKSYTGLKLIGESTLCLNIGDTYEEKGAVLIVKDKEAASTEYELKTTYYLGDVVVPTITTDDNKSFKVKYETEYKNTTYTAERTVCVGIEPISINVLSVGNKYNGDSIYIKAGETDILIDAGSRKESSTTIYNYITQPGRCEDGKLEYVIATHAHQDHIAGFVGSNANPSIFDRLEVGTLIKYAQTEATSQLSKDFDNKVDEIKGKGTKVYTALDCTKEQNGAKKEYTIANGTTMEVLYQKYYETSAKGNENLYSVCLMITHGANHYLLTGDLEEEGEESLIENNTLPQVEFFKANHHGSYTANSDALLSIIKPKSIAISCTVGSQEFTSNLDNVFPAQATISTIGKYTNNIFATQVVDGDSYKMFNGNIEFKSESGSTWEIHGSESDTLLKDCQWIKDHRTWPSLIA